MRVNVYNEEFTGEVEVFQKKAANTGFVFYGVRFYLKSHEDLHHTPQDDDRSAVTFFASSKEELHDYFMKAIEALQ